MITVKPNPSVLFDEIEEEAPPTLKEIGRYGAPKRTQNLNELLHQDYLDWLRWFQDPRTEALMRYAQEEIRTADYKITDLDLREPLAVAHLQGQLKQKERIANGEYFRAAFEHGQQAIRNADELAERRRSIPDQALQGLGGDIGDPGEESEVSFGAY